jgi:hypothetical protein
LRRYIAGYYFQSEKVLKTLHNPSNRHILDRLREAYPSGLTAAELNEKTCIPVKSVYKSLEELKDKEFIYDINYRGKPGRGKSKENVARYVINDINSLSRPASSSIYLLAPGYFEFTEDFESVFKLIDSQEKQEINRMLLRYVEKITRRAQDHDFKYTSTKKKEHCCPNCEINHEFRDFVRALLLHLINQFESSNDFIEFLHTNEFLTQEGYLRYLNVSTKLDKENADMDAKISEEWIGQLHSNGKAMANFVLKSRPELTPSHLRHLIEEKKRKIGAGYLSDEGAIFLVGTDLNLNFEKT